MPQGLSVSDVVNVEVNISPLSAAQRNFGLLCLIGDSDVISGFERLRLYADLEEVGDDFGLSAPEYLGATVYFSQSPRPAQLAIGRWIRTATAAFLEGGILTSSEQNINEWDTIDDGSFAISVNGTPQSITGLDFTSAVTLSNVAAIINDELTGASIEWTGSRFVITNSTTGATSTLSYASAVSPATGTDISAQLKLTSATSLAPVDGYAVETPLAAVTALADLTSEWYSCSFAASVMPDEEENEDIAAYIEAASPVRIFGITDTDTRTLDSTYHADISTVLKALGYTRSLTQYSSENDYAVASLIGRFSTVDFTANNTVITGFGKQEPGITYEVLTEQQAATLKNKRANVFTLYQNNTSIIQWGTMVSTLYIDERIGIDWLADAIQTACYNVLYTTTTKIPQTDAGNNRIQSAIAAVLTQGVNNGLIAPGVWNADGFGSLSNGDYLPTGFYIYAPPVALQNQSDREQRKSVTFQIAVKLSGAIQQINIILNVNR